MKKQMQLIVAGALMLMLPSLVFAETGTEPVQMLAEHPTGFTHRHKPAPPPPSARPVKIRPTRLTTYVGLGVIGNYVVDTGDDLSRIYKGGGGLELMIGARISPWLGAELSFFAAPQKTDPDLVGTEEITAMIMSAGVDMKIFLAPQSLRFEPFIQVGAGAYMFAEEFQEELTGAGLRVGGGVDIGVSPFMKISVRVLYHGFYMDNSDHEFGLVATDSAFLNTLTFGGNLQFHF